MATAIKKFVLMLERDVTTVPDEWRIKHTSDDVAALRPPVPVGKDFRVVSRNEFGMELLPEEKHGYKTVNGAKVRGAIYRVKAL